MGFANINLAEEISKALVAVGDKVVITYKEHRVFAPELNQKIKDLANAFLLNHIVSSDQRVLLIQRDTPSFVYSFLAVVAIGAIPVPLNPKIEGNTLKYILADSRAAAVIVDSKEFGRLREVLQSSVYLEKNKIIVDGQYADFDVSEPELVLLGQLMHSFSADSFRFYHKKKNSVAFWQYTSGTTGMPKAVQHSQETMLVNTNTFAVNVLGINENDRLYSIPKMFFGYGLGNSLFFPLLTGASVLLDDSWPGLDTIIGNISKFKPTVLFAVPAIYSLILKNIDTIDQSIFNEVRLFVSAGAPLPEDINLQWQQHFGQLITDGIGCTEIGHIYLTNMPPMIIPGATGWPVDGYEVKLINDEGEEVDNLGELCIRPTYHSLGYWENPGKTNERFRNEWYRSGDLFERDEETGAYYYKDRKDNLFKAFNGRWVNPSDIEPLLIKQFKFRECALVGRLNNEGLVVPVLFVCSDHQPDEEVIGGFLKQHVESYKIPRKIFYMQELPRNENGKVVRNRLTENLAEIVQL